jgi:hypothetical protein
MKRIKAALIFVAVAGFVGTARAAEDPTGTWKWTVKIGENSFEAALKLKLEGDKLTGALGGGQSNQETPISEASFKDGKVSFTVVRERDGQKVTIKYNGTLSGDTITGKSERAGQGGQKQTTDWVAKRQK